MRIIAATVITVIIAISSVGSHTNRSASAQAATPPAAHLTTCQGYGLTGDAANDCAWLLSVETVLEGPNNTSVLNWDSTAFWNTTDNKSDWTGVTADTTSKRVTRIRLTNQGLKGQIPPELGKLSEFFILELRNDQLTGTIPKELGDLPKLYQLLLDGNKLTGTIPKELGNATKLFNIFLGGNQLTGTIPKELGNLTELGSLGLQNNDLSGSIPSEIVDGLTLLLALYLHGNSKLMPSSPDSSILEDISTMTSLWNLGLSGIESMKGYDLNQLAPHLSGMTSMRALYFSDLDMTGSLSALTDLKYAPDGQTEEELVLKNLADIEMRNNKLTGPIPYEFNDMNFWWIDLRNNQLSGEIPDLSTMSTYASGVMLSNNMLTGGLTTVSQGVPKVKFPTTLNYLYLDHNKLTGPIPDFSEFTGLLRLKLNNNNFSGPIPESLGTLSSLSRLHLNDNNLSGAMPSWLSNMQSTRFVELFLDGNQITGSIQSLEIGTKIDLDFDIGDTSAYISIPSGAAPTGTKLNFKARDASTVSEPFIRFAASGNHLIDINAVDANNADIGFLQMKTTVCVKIPPGMPGDSDLYHLSDTAGSIWVPLEAPPSDDVPERFREGYACGNTYEFSTFAVGEVAPSGQKISRLASTIPSVTLSPGGSVALAVNTYGVQDILDNDLAENVTYEWSVEPSGGSFAEIDPSADADDVVNEPQAIFVVPSSPGVYTVKIALGRDECDDKDGKFDGCYVEIQVKVRRPLAALEPTAVPVNPAGDIPSIMNVADGAQSEVFTPVEGGSYIDENLGVSVVAKPGAVPNSEFIGVRAYSTVPASNIGQTHHRYTLEGQNYRIAAYGSEGEELSGYALNAPVDVCIPLPPRLTANISKVAMVSMRDDGTLAVHTSNVRFSGNQGLELCGTISELSANVAAGFIGSPSALPTPAPTIEPEPPETGGNAASSNIIILLVMFGVAISVLGLATLRRAKRR